MSIATRLSGLTRVAILLLTAIFASLALVVAQEEAPDPVELSVGDPSPETFFATAPIEVTDEAETERARAAAAAAVPDVYRIDTQATEAVLGSVAEVFQNTVEGAEPIPVEPPATTTTEAGTTSTTGGDTSTTVETTTTTVAPDPLTREEQIALLQAFHPLLEDETLDTLVRLINDDRERAESDETELFPILQDAALTFADDVMFEGIRPTEVDAVRSQLVTEPRPLVLLPEEERDAAEMAVADILSVYIQPNEFFDEDATERNRQAARAAVDDVTREYSTGERIVDVGERLTQVQFAAIDELGLNVSDEEPLPLRAMALIAAIVVLLAAVFMARVTRAFWQDPKKVALFGLLVVLAAVASRIPELVVRDRIELGFLLPAALFGYLAANLFDARIAVLMAVPITVFTALATGDLALVVFAAGATLTPIPLVTSVASRAELNLAVIFSAGIQVPLAIALAWFFYGPDAADLQDVLTVSAVWGFIGGIASGVVALGVMPILSSAFGVTTTQTLLDLTDRNHPALRRIEDMAPGTFNHSVLVGNLADRAARAIGANPLLARAMAYYHDLGKTVQPKYFVENQFGVTNPHDRLPPEESSAIIRGHVSEGLRLAREYRIPPDVAQGILTHHGTSLMRYFSHKAEEAYGERIELSDYRHRGRKPRTKERVILMLADAAEASARALVQHEDPTSESIRGLVEAIIAEKVEDGQLEESEVTFGELTRIKEAFVDALIGYYHTRIPYPGFPAARSAQPA
ncbi:MAG TPA: HDIG domain-containing protein [Acidimicrobiia bacterium]|nr:HDIG domain-containing protein [Acidimicrobiia bacterium]